MLGQPATMTSLNISLINITNKNSREFVLPKYGNLDIVQNLLILTLSKFGHFQYYLNMIILVYKYSSWSIIIIYEISVATVHIAQNFADCFPKDIFGKNVGCFA